MSEENICPGCGRHCDLNEPHCGRGEEYRRTGKMPQQRQGKDHDHEMRTAHYQATDMNDKLIVNLRDLNHIMRLLYEGKASQKRILIILNEAGAITQRDLTERLGIQPGSASEILAKLESTGMIIRTRNETDRRTTDVCLTDRGREFAQEAQEQRRKRHEEMFSCLSEEERQELLSLLERVWADWSVRYREGRSMHGHGHHDGYGHHGGQGHHEGHGHHGGQGHHEGHGHHGDQGHHEEHGHHEGNGHPESHEHHDGSYGQGGN